MYVLWLTEDTGILLCDSLSHSLRKGLSVNLALTIIKLGYLAVSPSHPSVVMPLPPIAPGL